MAQAWAYQAADLGLGRDQVRLGRRHGGLLERDLDLVRLLVELDEHIPLLHAVVVIHQHLHHLAGYPGGHEGHVAVDVSVVGTHRVERRIDPRDQEVTADRQRGHNSGPQQPLSVAVPRRRGDGRLGLADAAPSVGVAGASGARADRSWQPTRCTARPLREGPAWLRSTRESFENPYWPPFSWLDSLVRAYKCRQHPTLSPRVGERVGCGGRMLGFRGNNE